MSSLTAPREPIYVRPLDSKRVYYQKTRNQFNFEKPEGEMLSYLITAITFMNKLTTEYENAGIEKVSVVPDDIQPYKRLLFRPDTNLMSAGWISRAYDEDMDYMLEKFMPSNPHHGSDDIWRLSNSEWRFTFCTARQNLGQEGVITFSNSGWTDTGIWVGYLQIGMACDFKIRGDRDAFMRDVMLMKLTMT